MKVELLAKTRVPYLQQEATIALDVMASHAQAHEKLQEYASKVRDTEYNIAANNGKIAYEAWLDRTLQALQDQVKGQQDALQKVIHSRGPF